MPRPLDLFLWLDDSAPRYWTVAWGVFGVWFLSAILAYVPGDRWRRWNHPAVHAGLMLLMLVAFRWPGIADNHELDNPDESQLIAGALTLAHHGEYWGEVDCGSAGPLDMLPLVAPLLVGQPIDYVGARAVGILLLWGSCVFGWLIVRHSVGDRIGRLLVMPAACCIGFTCYSDFVQYSSEQAPIFFCALAAWLAFGSFSRDGLVTSRLRLALAGLVTILLPFSKLQATPFTAVIGLWALVVTLRQEKLPWRRRFTDAGWLAGGAALGLGLMALAIAHGGGFVDFYETYFLPNVNYVAARDYPWAAFPPRLWRLVQIVWGFVYFFVPALALAGLALALSPWLPRAARRAPIFGGLLFLTGFFVVAAPGREFQHYLQFLIFPMSLASALVFGEFAAAGSAIRRWAWVLLVLLAGVGPQVYCRIRDANPYLEHLRQAQGKPRGAVAQQILTYARPGDTLTVWGWMPTFHVQTQLPQGTRDAHTERQLSNNPLRPYFQRRFLRDIEKNRPAVFVDAVGEKNFGYHARHPDGNENVPWLSPFIVNTYTQVADVETSRIYVRKDRLSEIQAAPTPTR